MVSKKIITLNKRRKQQLQNNYTKLGKHRNKFLTLYGNYGGRKVKDDIQKPIQELEKERSKNSENNYKSCTG